MRFLITKLPLSSQKLAIVPTYPPEKDFSLQKALGHLNENIRTMVEQSKEKTKSKNQKRSSSSHSTSSSKEEPTENKCSQIEDDKCLSIHASENEMEEDYKTLMLTKPTKKVTDPGDKKSDEILLTELAESLDENVKTQLADIVNKH